LKVLGIDYGSKRIGLALGDENLKLATPFKSISNNLSTYDKILELVEEYKVVKIVIGLPLTLRGKEGQRAHEVREFAEKLRSYLPNGIEIIFWDERFTTEEAYRFLEGYSFKKKKEYKDSVAAYIILNEYLDNL